MAESKKYFFKVILAYKGTNYFGWQAQSADTSSESYPTIQGQIQKALYKIMQSKNCIVAGTSRTDAGVHAKGQIARIEIPNYLNSEKLMLGLNTELPADIRVLSCEEVDASFSPGTLVSQKEYHYYFSNSEVLDPIFSDFVAHFQRKMDMDLFREACSIFVGKFDFSSFYLSSSNIKSTVRSVTSCELDKVHFPGSNMDVYCLKIVGDGFLKQMLRIMVQSLYLVAQGNLKPADLQFALEKPNATEAICRSAPAKGLQLVAIRF